MTWLLVHAVCVHTSLHSLAGKFAVSMDMSPRGQCEGLFIRALAALANVATS